MLQELVFISYLFNIFIGLFVGVLLLVIKTSPQLKQLKYRRAKTYLSIATLITAIGNAVILFFGMENQMVDFFSLTSLVIASLQACLFTFLVLTLFNSGYVNPQNVIKHLLPTFVFLVVYIVMVSSRSDTAVYSVDGFLKNIANPALFLRGLYALTYIVQLFIYTRLFFRERKKYIEKINDYFADVSGLQLQLGTNLFFQALGVGIAVLLFCFFPGPIQDITINMLVTFFYFGFAVSYINYQYTLLQVIPAVVTPNEEWESVGEMYPSLLEIKEVTPVDLLRGRLDEFLLQEPLYLMQGVVIDDIANSINVSKRTLSSYINATFGKNFNCWINSLRIEHAKKLIDSSPGLTLQEVAELSGFADNAMMSRSFKQLTGQLPSAYRNKSFPINAPYDQN